MRVKLQVPWVVVTVCAPGAVIVKPGGKASVIWKVAAPADPALV